VAFRSPDPEDGTNWLETYCDLARAYPADEQVDDVLIVGATAGGAGAMPGLVVRVPRDGPTGPLDYAAVSLGRQCLPLFMLRLLDERFTRIRTGAPAGHLEYLLPGKTQTSGPDPAAQHNIGSAPLAGELAAAIKEKATELKCPGCAGRSFDCLDDAYYLVAAKDYHFGKLGAPYLPVGIVRCENCGHVMLFSTKVLRLTPSE
jgi:hypothetical protein